MKKALFILVFAFFLAWNVFAQQAHKHTVSFGSGGLAGMVINYEYMLFPNFSLVIDAGTSVSIFPVNYVYNAAAHARWFPVSDSAGKTQGFFVSGGLGFGGIVRDLYDSGYELDGFLFSIDMGHKLGINKSRGFVFTPILDFNVVLGNKVLIHHEDDKRESKFGVGYNPNFKLLIGWAF